MSSFGPGMKTFGPWEHLVLVLATVGLVDSVYLSLNVIFPQLKLICPTSGIINCAGVTSSPYSDLFGIVPVAFLGLGWFALVIILMLWRPRVFPYALVLLWTASVVMVGYLVFVELSILHEICLYCTLAHVLTVVLGVPILKLALREI